MSCAGATVRIIDRNLIGELGTVVLATEHYLVLERMGDLGAVSLHRLARLSRMPKVGERITIRYTGKKGTVA